MDFDFSKVNLEYLLIARDLARTNPDLGVTLLGLPKNMAQQLAELTAHELALLTRFHPPLLAPRHEAWWWQRLITALHEGDAEELALILDHAGTMVEC